MYPPSPISSAPHVDPMPVSVVVVMLYANRPRTHHHGLSLSLAVLVRLVLGDDGTDGLCAVRAVAFTADAVPTSDSEAETHACCLVCCMDSSDVKCLMSNQIWCGRGMVKSLVSGLVTCT